MSAVEVAARKNADAVLADVTLVLEHACEDDLGVVKDLVLRGVGVCGFEVECAKGLRGLEILSLSHNKLTSLSSFRAFETLLEVNLNFNGLTSLDGLSSPRLRRLYLSNNRLDVESVAAAVAGLPELTTLCLYRNRLDDLAATLRALGPLKRLRELDLDGNPCSFDSSYRHQIVERLPRLHALDGDSVEPLDREMAQMFFRQQRPAKEQPDVNCRPSTAPAQRPSASSQLPRGPVRIFNSDFLNNHPIMLEYVGKGVVADSLKTGSGTAQVAAPAANTQGMPPEEGTCSRRSFVKRLAHQVAGASDAPEAALADKSAVDSGDARQTQSHAEPNTADRSTAATSRASKSIAGTGVSQARVADTPSLQEDLSDPNCLIRKLLRQVELLQQQVKELEGKNMLPGGSATIADLAAENESLQVECSNLYTLQNENKTLRVELERVRAHNEELQKLHRQQETSGARSETAPESNHSQGQGQTSKPKGRVDVTSVLAELEADPDNGLDDEILSLIRRNADGLKRIRRDLKMTKRGMLGKPPAQEQQHTPHVPSTRVLPQQTASRRSSHSPKARVARGTPQRRTGAPSGQQPASTFSGVSGKSVYDDIVSSWKPSSNNT